MKKIYGWIFLLLLSSCAETPVTRFRPMKRKAAASRKKEFFIKKKVILLDFFNESHFGGDDLSVQLTEEIRKEMVKTSNYTFDPLLRGAFQASRQVYQSGGGYQGLLVEKAKQKGVNLIVFGRILDSFVRQKEDSYGLIKQVRYLAGAKVEVRVIDVDTELEVGKKEVETFFEDKNYQFLEKSPKREAIFRQELLRRSAKATVKDLLKFVNAHSFKKPWSGKVAKIIGKNIYLNAGKQSGIKVGDILKVMIDGEKIFDPTTGALIGKSKGQVKSTIEIIDYFGNDGSIGVIHSGGSVQIGDIVQLY